MSVQVSLSVLDSISVASPCSMRWEDMTGDDRVRHCQHCNLNVYNLSGMTRKESEDLLLTRTGRLCARFYRRADGTVLTADCPVGLAAARQRLMRLATRVAAAAVALLTGGVLLGDRSRATASLGAREPFSFIRAWLSPVVPMPPPIMGRMMMGDVCTTVAPTPSTQPPTPAPTDVSIAMPSFLGGR